MGVAAGPEQARAVLEIVRPDRRRNLATDLLECAAPRAGCPTPVGPHRIGGVP